ncbi:hypothetical protein FIBSPDRAFT_439426 [Athelia psychrophila]|uniref:Uncharacterized protein n=1 Tax=Athelia psychrophila TaxID=1759441 RepID=A0A166VT23_9AGAM|nr:hypothetical protein FIBSPDRAFT_439426 [Fibularhizoctonia sp. CBS 109695]
MQARHKPLLDTGNPNSAACSFAKYSPIKTAGSNAIAFGARCNTTTKSMTSRSCTFMMRIPKDPITRHNTSLCPLSRYRTLRSTHSLSHNYYGRSLILGDKTVY